MSSRARARSLVSASSHLSSDEQEVYHEVVGQLANRGFRLNSLLDFWEQLLDEDGMMRSFEPRRSSTNDVVRLAIIPQSRSGDGGCALASLWSEDPIKPQVMVTHNWANGFGKLVAAILAVAGMLLGNASFHVLQNEEDDDFAAPFSRKDSKASIDVHITYI